MKHHSGPSTSTLNNWYEEPSEKTEHLPKSVPLSPTTTLQHTPYSSDQDHERQRRLNRQSVFGEIPTTAFGPPESYPAEHPEEAPRSEYKVTRIARRIHGWSWQAVSNTSMSVSLSSHSCQSSLLVWALEPSMSQCPASRVTRRL